MFKYVTESELHDYLVDNFHLYFDFPLKANEYQLSKGRVDFLGDDSETLYVIELKKEIINKHTINQLKRYMKTMSIDFPNRKIKGIATAPEVASTLDVSALPDNIEIKLLDNVYYHGKINSCITLTDTVKEALERIAASENRSLNNLIETILKDYLQKEEG